MRRQKQQRSRSRRESPQSTAATSPSLVPSNTLCLSQGVDLNTNLGEGFGTYKIAGESDLLPYVTSANIACGAHAGDPLVMEAALEELRYYGLSLGAHIGYPDLAGFGRREIHLSSAELRASVLFQIGALSGLAKTMGFEITQVRPHGFLYRQMTNDVRIATVVAKAVAEYDRWLVLIGAVGPALITAGERAGLRVAGEAWVDRAYDPNGSLLPHSHSRAILKSPREIINQAQTLIARREVVAVDGSRVPIDFQTIHLHAGMPNAKEIAETIRNMLPTACPLTAEPFTLGPVEDPGLAFSS
ncbi:MAG: LamB/YcsF family protein [Candidatus Melainabacteria bacterium]|nr:MAG: LamB/YcsF family protein [Candidatus Melainabacteria bacterium]